MASRLLFILLILGIGQVNAQQVITLEKGFKTAAFDNKLQSLTDSSKSLTFNQVLYRRDWRTIPGNYPNFGENPFPHWVRFTVRNESPHVQSVTLLTKGVDSLQAYLTLGQRIIRTFPVSGSHIPLGFRENPGSYLTYSFDLLPGRDYTMWVRIMNINYRMSASPFKLMESWEARRYLQSKSFFNSLYIGGMCIILLFSIVLTILFDEEVYAYYFGCVLCSLFIMLIYNDFTYLIFDELPAVVRSKDIFGILAAMVPALYTLFAEKYLRISVFHQSRLVTFSRVVIGFQTVMLVFFMATGVPLFEVRAFFYPSMMALSVISLIYVYRAIRNRYRPAWLFLLASTPVSIAIMIESFSDIHHIPAQDIHDIYYYATLFEMFALTLGLAFRFKLDSDQRRYLQKEILVTQITTHEQERGIIASDLHDAIGAQLSAIRLNLDFLQVQYFPNSSKDWWAPIYRILSLLGENVSTIAARMRNSNLEELGLRVMLEEVYGHLDNPKFEFHFHGMDQRLPAEVEKELYIVIVEAFNNAAKYSKATLINVQMIRERNLLTIFIEDNGVGFDIHSHSTGQGMHNMEFRIREHLRGHFSVDSQPGTGTVIIIKIDLNEEM